MSNRSAGKAFPNPYRIADRRQRAARRRVEGPVARFAASFLPAVGALAAVWLARGLYGTLLGGSAAAFAAGFTGIVARIGLVLAAALALSTYDALVRGPDRGVLDLHPLLPGPWLAARTEGLVRGRASWLALGLVFLLPLASHPIALLLGAGVVSGAWCAGLGAGLGINLAAPGLAAEPSLAGVFDALRGSNPRIQAALLYAPGVALALAGTSTIAAAWGAGRVLAGDATGAFALPAPFVVGALGMALAVRAAPAMAGIGAVIGEIDAAWASAGAAEDGRLVYLEWVVRFAPAPLRLGLRKELRHLWRGHRAWITGSWGLALLAAIAGWTTAADGPARLVQVGAGGLVVLGFAGVRLGATDPAWLDAFLPIHGRRTARAAALFACMQVIVSVGFVALLVRQGAAAFLPLARLEAMALALALLAAWIGDRLRARGGALYVPAALLVWALGGAA